MLKRRQDGPPKFPFFLKNRPKILAITVFGPRCLLEASKRHLGPKTVIARIFGRFLRKNGNFGGPSWRRFNIKNRIF